MGYRNALITVGKEKLTREYDRDTEVVNTYVSGVGEIEHALVAFSCKRNKKDNDVRIRGRVINYMQNGRKYDGTSLLRRHHYSIIMQNQDQLIEGSGV